MIDVYKLINSKAISEHCRKIIQEYHSSFYWFTDEGLNLCGFSEKRY